MKYAILSDVHGNLEALEAILADCREKTVDKIFCIGDIVGYGASPKECIKLIKENCTAAVVGNHDHAVIGKTSCEYFNINAKKAVEWTRSQIGDSEIKFLESLQFIMPYENFLLTHSSIYKPQNWSYVLDEQDALKFFSRMNDTFISFIGHSHIPIVFEYNHSYIDVIYKINDFKLILKNKYIINVGGAGQPRDSNSNAPYLIYDTKKNKVSLIRVEYDIETSKEKILKAGLPYFLAERLDYGR